MPLMAKIRFSLGTIMMFVVMAAAGMALFVKVEQHTDGMLPPGWNLDVPILFLLAIVLTAVALGSWKEHSAVQMMLQVTLAFFGCLTLIWIGEAQYERAIRYWCQSTFAATVTVPMLARRYVKSALPRGPQREWWKKNCEAVFFSFLTLVLVMAGGLIQGAVYTAGSAISAGSSPAAVPTPVMPPVIPSPAGRQSSPCPEWLSTLVFVNAYSRVGVHVIRSSLSSASRSPGHSASTSLPQPLGPRHDRRARRPGPPGCAGSGDRKSPVDAAKLIGPPQAQDPPPALLGLRRFAPMPVHHRLAEPQLGILRIEPSPVARLQRPPASRPSSGGFARSGQTACARSSRSAPSRPGCARDNRAPSRHSLPLDGDRTQVEQHKRIVGPVLQLRR